MSAPLVIVLFTVALTSGTASAHTQLLSSDPADGAHLPKAPHQVVLTFGAAPLTISPAVVATGPGLTRYQLTPQVKGAAVSAQWPDSTPAGTYRVSYRVVAKDGHPIEGEIEFTINSTQSSATSPSPISTTATRTTAAAPTSQEASSDGSFPAWGLGLGALALALVLVLLIVVVVKMKRSSS